MIDPHKYNQLIFNKGTKEIHSRNIIVQQVVREQLDIDMPKNTLDKDIISFAKMY